MKFLLAILIAVPCLSLANSFDKLAKTNVSHLQLMINNLNMFLWNNMESFRKSQDGKGGPSLEFIKFFASDNNGLSVDAFSTAPVGDVTPEKCKFLANEFKSNLFGDEQLIALLPVFSYYDIPEHEIRDFVTKANVRVILSAKENKQLSVKCSN